MVLFSTMKEPRGGHDFSLRCRLVVCWATARLLEGTRAEIFGVEDNTTTTTIPIIFVGQHEEGLGCAAPETVGPPGDRCVQVFSKRKKYLWSPAMHHLEACQMGLAVFVGN